jgi:PAS domain S-box-containing protein
MTKQRTQSPLSDPSTSLIKPSLPPPPPRAVEAAWPDLFANLQDAYAKVIDTQFELERRAAESEDSRDLLRQIIASMSEALFLLDRTGRIMQVNPAALELIGCEEADCLGHSFAEICVAPNAPASAWKLLNLSPRGMISRLDTELRSRSGSPIPVSLSASVVRDRHGRIDGVLIVARDITERKRAEAELRRHRDHLAELVAERTREVQAAHDRIQQLAQQVITAQEEERRRVARELHDETGQVLIGIKLNLQVLARKIPPELPELRAEADHLRQRVNEATERLHALSRGLRPPMLDELGLEPALRRLAADFERNTGLLVHVESGGPEARLPQAVETVCYRIAQEALTNVARHAQASLARIVLTQHAQQLSLSIQDDGQGFDPATLHARRDGMGLLGMKERATMLGGLMEIVSAPGQGTRLTIVVPIQETAP